MGRKERMRKNYNKWEVIYRCAKIVDEHVNLPCRRLGGELVAWDTIIEKLDELWEYPDNAESLYSKLPTTNGAQREYLLGKDDERL